jgi:hypothetical protein
MHDGPEQEARDRELMEADPNNPKPSKLGWVDPGYLQKLLGFDSVKDTEGAFERWIEEQGL